MVEASASLGRKVDVNVNNLACVSTNSFFRPVSSEARSLDGKRVHMALIDEVHEHPTGMVVEKMQLGTKGRRQPLIFEITNAGYDRWAFQLPQKPPSRGPWHMLCMLAARLR